MATTKLPRRKAIGQRGSSFEYVGGEQLPCVHAQWMKNGAYDDPIYDPTAPKWLGFVDAISVSCKIILTRFQTGDGTTTVDRTGYVAVFEVSDLTTDDDHLRFRFAKRLKELD